MTSVSTPFNVDLMRHRRRCHCLRRCRRRCRAIAAVTAVAAVAAAAATNAVSVAVNDICWLIVVCPRCCLCFRRRCLPPPFPLLAADVIGDGGNCGDGCGGDGGRGDDGAFRSFSGMMFKILHIKCYILNIKLDEEGGGRRMDVAAAVTMRATTVTTSGNGNDKWQ